jgi:anti-anti-sigma factor
MAIEPNEPAPPKGGRPRPGTVTLGHHAPGLAVVNMRGEHDITTHRALLEALEEAAAQSNVLVDLSECTFIDSTVIAALIATAQALQARQEQLVLVIPPEQRQPTRVAALTNLGEILPCHTTLRAALAGLAQSRE